ncbi:MAG: MauE/DoxX family redox-associated membrane protein [Ginsengibacter sp.]
MMQKKIPDIICGMLIFLFVYAAISKLIDRQHFQAVLAQMLMIRNVASFISVALPVTELLVCGFLFMPATRLFGLCASFVLLILLTVYIGYIILFDPHLPCNCGGVLEQMSWTQHLVFNLAFILLSATGIKIYQANKNIVATHRLRVRQPQGKS